ncbi:hypothetical protein BM1_09613 [Bipolaris maydis]|nr:hypothetical protein BM1_09613 [Bipolaris maydis]
MRGVTSTTLGASKDRSTKHGSRWTYGLRLQVWKTSVFVFAICASSVFSINLAFTIWSLATWHTNMGNLYEGDCGRVKVLNSAVHVLINILSTILFTASNYCMQCLSAPTRSAVDKAHMQSEWLDIGISSMRNLKHIKRQDLILWLLLAITSLPLHLLYNSAVYASISSNSYFAFSVSESFVNSAECINCATQPNLYTNLTNDSIFKGYPNGEFPEILHSLWSRAQNGSLARLEPAECIDEYATAIQSFRRNVLLVARDEDMPPQHENTFINDSYVYDAVAFASIYAKNPEQSADAYRWICSGLPPKENNDHCTDRISEIRSNTSAWRVGGDGCYSVQDASNPHIWTSGCSDFSDTKKYPVSFCLSETAPSRCKVRFNSTILVIVTVVNFLKAILMFYIVFKPFDQPLLTMGDAVASFLDDPDPSTRDMCLLSIRDTRHGHFRAGVRRWLTPKASWMDAMSKTRRTITITMYAAAIAVSLYLLWFSIHKLPKATSVSPAGLASLGFGAVDPRTMIIGGLGNTNLIANTLIANTPQLIISFLNYFYNAHFTAMLLGYEWISYALKRKGLRVSQSPQGKQRSTYFLQLPYRVSVPLMIMGGTLHWLVSQSIFLVSIDLYDYMDNRSAAGQQWLKDEAYDPRDELMSITTCGYSPLAIICVIVFGSLMFIALLAVGFVPYKRVMPLASSCSMAISAACHPESETRVSTHEVQWGVLKASDNPDDVGHCSFSKGPVSQPVVGHLYI